MKRIAPVSFLIFAALACRGGAAPRPLGAANDDVRSVEISRGRESFSLLQDSPGVWRVVPPDDRVDAADAAALLDGLRGLRPQVRLSKDDAAYGLSPLDGTNVRAAGGGSEPIFAARFGRRGPGGAVHMAAGEGSDV